MPDIIKRSLRFLGWMLLVPGVLMALFGCVRAVGGVATWVGGESADGVVTSIKISPGDGATGKPSSRGEQSVITFRTADGQVVTFTHPMGGTSAPYAMQEHVRVVYDAEAPEDAVVPGSLAFLTMAWLLLLAAALMLVVAGVTVLLLGALPWESRSRAGMCAPRTASPIDGAVNGIARLAIAALQKTGRRV